MPWYNTQSDIHCWSNFCCSVFFRYLSLAVGGPLALTSANVSSATSPLCVEEFASLWPQVDLVVDAGPLCQLGTPQEEQRKGSTVLDLSVEGYFKILRPGWYVLDFSDSYSVIAFRFWSNPSMR